MPSPPVSVTSDVTNRSNLVLVVEDDLDDQFIIRMHLEAGGFEVRTVAGLQEALDCLRGGQHAYDAVVLDLGLPGRIDDPLGTLCRATDAPVVVHSSASEADLRKCLRRGAAASVSKLAPAEALALALQRVLHSEVATLEPLPAASADLAGSADMRIAIDAIVEHMADLCGVSTWMVTRVVGDDWIILAANDPNYGLQAGTVLKWSDSFCCRMVEGLGPRVVPDAHAEPAYRDAPVGFQLEIGTYVGLPLAIEGEGLFGTLCGIQPEVHPDPERLRELGPVMQMIAQQLSVNLALDLERSRLQRRLDVAEALAQYDMLTGIGNRRAWTQAVDTEQARCERFGHPAGILVLDLDDLKVVNDEDGHAAGDDLIRRAAGVLRTSIRGSDQAFRIGGDEFALLLPEAREAAVLETVARLDEAFVASGIPMSIGAATRRADEHLEATAARADAAMYARKAERRR